ncbi:ATP-binding cassette domain-containing protein [Actinosynnema sp. NPDC047251]|uniref:ABC-type transporter, ATPase subunit n=1 Tax=Saccharothrix espanaensis (strain ATCC 51144 / DSM 44229 / JCM 9112 / NBRC 15066 / NRRL 15764) TaxID=1179773 RepID=K0JZ90_SACES|nr:ATP-binding cassette domain-containing protein [Saccharothrix espanaensis]CCH33305.1 ABC-type transporter, ATPase subunit [Saccharothrix espanaensis DSM 44229]
MTALRVVGVRRSFEHPGGTVHVLRGVDLEVSAGELVTLSGPSGSGKSALLSVLSGFDRADDGTVEMCGEVLTAPPAWRLCALLPQAMGLAGELTLAENVALPLRLSGAGADVGGVAVLLAELGIGDLADRYPAEVSFGQQQRAALARAVIGSPKVLLADEPTAHLDQVSAPTAVRVLRRAADAGAAVLIATHHEEVHRAADRTVVLSGGRVSVG